MNNGAGYFHNFAWKECIMQTNQNSRVTRCLVIILNQMTKFQFWYFRHHLTNHQALGLIASSVTLMVWRLLPVLCQNPPTNLTLNYETSETKADFNCWTMCWKGKGKRDSKKVGLDSSQWQWVHISVEVLRIKTEKMSAKGHQTPWTLGFTVDRPQAIPIMKDSCRELSGVYYRIR